MSAHVVGGRQIPQQLAVIDIVKEPPMSILCHAPLPPYFSAFLDPQSIDASIPPRERPL